MNLKIAVLGLLAPIAAWAGPWGQAPVMGWNSYDVYGTAIVEKEVLDNAKVMQQKLLPLGYDTVVIDARWYDTEPVNDDRDFYKRAGAKLEADAYGRLIPAPNRFPSSSGGKGFQPLASRLHAMGLKFGVHIMRGIPRQAVRDATPIQGSPFRADAAGNTLSTCGWLADMYGVRNDPAGQAWYDSIFRQYAAWGLDFVKVDDLSNPYSGDEIEMIRKAIKRSGRSIVFSTSPGPTSPDHASHIAGQANMWRISGDFWDRWSSLSAQFDLMSRWQGVGGPGHWPDADMIPLGHVGIRSWIAGPDRQSRFTPAEQRTLMSFWCLAPSPLFLGMNLVDLDAATLAMLSNSEVLALDQDPKFSPARRLRVNPEVWLRPLAKGDWALGVFNRSKEPLKVPGGLAGLGFTPSGKARDLWKHVELDAAQALDAEVAPHDTLLLRLAGSYVAVPSPTPTPLAAGEIFEAEDGKLSGGATVASDHMDYSGKGFVAGYYEGTGQSTELSLPSLRKGRQKALLHYSNGMDTPQTLSLVVNHGKPVKLTLPSTEGWEAWALLELSLDLKKGANSVAFVKGPGDGCVNLDCLILPGAASRGKAMQGDELKSKEKGALQASAPLTGKDPLLLDAQDLAWWQDAKLGLFVHWGLYAVLGRGEWAMHNEKIPAAEYAKLAGRFNPQHYDPAKWMDVAKAAGMRYAVMTARHHDGFALWDSPGSWGAYDAPHSAAKRDLVRPFVDAARSAGLRVGLYYSPMDWRFPGYFHPKEMPENAALMKRQGYAQVEELATRYGHLDILWYDGGWLAHQGSDADAAWFWEPDKLNAMLRSHQPKILISPRSGSRGDFDTDEGGGTPKGPIRARAWEKCLSVIQIGSWGYFPTSPAMKPSELVRLFTETLVRGGNFLLNVGPDPEGRIPADQADALKKLGAWVKPRGRAIYGTRPGPWQPQDGVYGSTQKGNKAYLFVLAWPKDGAALELPATLAKPKGLRVIPKGEARLEQVGSNWRLSVDARYRDKDVTTIEWDL